MSTSGFMVVFLVSYALAPECWKKDVCHFPDTKLLGDSFLYVSTKYIYPTSCVRLCSLTAGCVGATLDPLMETCRLYGESASFGITPDLGTSLWLFQAAMVPCIRVRNTTTGGLMLMLVSFWFMENDINYTCKSIQFNCPQYSLMVCP